MNSGFEILFRVSFRHHYFRNEIPNCFSVEPTKETALLLRNYSFIFKQTSDGFILAYEAYNNQNIRNRDAINLFTDILRFQVKLNDQLFYNYSDVSSNSIFKQVFYFNNFIETESQLHRNEFVQEADLISMREISTELFPKPFAIIDIQLNKINVNQYYIRFKEKSTVWRYLLVSEHLKTLTNPAILNPLIVFTGPFEITLPNNSKALLFESEELISIKQKSDKQFQLVENFDKTANKGKVIVKNLPHPNVNMISKLNIGQKGVYSEIII